METVTHGLSLGSDALVLTSSAVTSVSIDGVSVLVDGIDSSAQMEGASVTALVNDVTCASCMTKGLLVALAVDDPIISIVFNASLLSCVISPNTIVLDSVWTSISSFMPKIS